MLTILAILIFIPLSVCLVLDIAFLVLWLRFAKVIFKIFFWILDVIVWILFLMLVFIILLLFI